MRILTTAAQVRRVSGIPGPGDFPPYPYGDPIPREVGQALLDGLSEISWHADRDFLSDDGGFILIFDSPEEFRRCPFGMQEVALLEDVRRLDAAGETWWLCLALANNETSIDFAFRAAVAPPEVSKQLTEHFKAMGEC